jgi:hypothetical protein
MAQKLKCERCGNTAFREEPTGSACIICGNFIFSDDCTLGDEWLQYKINSQYGKLSDWVKGDFETEARSWRLIEEVYPPSKDDEFEGYSRDTSFIMEWYRRRVQKR